MTWDELESLSESCEREGVTKRRLEFPPDRSEGDRSEETDATNVDIATNE